MKRRLLFFLLVFLFVYFVLNHLNDGKTLLLLLIEAKWQFVILALVLQIIHFIATGLLYQKALYLYGTKWKLVEVLPLVLASLSLNTFAPLAPLPGSGIFIQKARQDNIPALNVTAPIFLVVLFDYLALTPLLISGIIFLLINYSVYLYQIIGVIIFLIMAAALFFILIFGIISPKILIFVFRLVEIVINGINRLFRKRSYFMEGWSNKRTLQFIDLSKKFLDGKRDRKDLFIIAFAKHLVDLSSLYLLFLAFGGTIPVTALLTGYSLMILFWIVTPTPQGVGFVEAITPTIFSSMGVSVETATLAVLAFRGLNLWLPVLIGFLFLHNIIRNKAEEN